MLAGSSTLDFRIELSISRTAILDPLLWLRPLVVEPHHQGRALQPLPTIRRYIHFASGRSNSRWFVGLHGSVWIVGDSDNSLDILLTYIATAQQ